MEAAEGGRDNAAEAVGVEVEEGEVGEEAEFVGKVAGDVSVVEVDSGNDGDGGGGGGGGAEDAGVGADVGAVPVAGEVEGVGEDGGFPCLEGNVGLPELGVGESQPWVDGDGESVTFPLAVDGEEEEEEGKEEGEERRRHGGRERERERGSHRERRGGGGGCLHMGEEERGLCL